MRTSTVGSAHPTYDSGKLALMAGPHRLRCAETWAFPDAQAPRYLLHDRDTAFTDVRSIFGAMQINEVLTASLSRSDVSASVT
jgi:hypothetical protein